VLFQHIQQAMDTGGGFFGHAVHGCREFAALVVVPVSSVRSRLVQYHVGFPRAGHP